MSVVLKAKNISKSFGKTEVLKDISFDLSEGEVLSIIGTSGSGKTTLLRCLNSLEVADKGVITVGDEIVFKDGQKISEKALKENYNHFGLVFQSFNLFPQYTVLENVCLAPQLLKKGSKEEIKEQALDIIKRVGLLDKIDNYPCQLSGGQQQRVAIARALILKPEILCFDEPTSALDPELTGEVLKVIRSLKDSQMTMIVVTHEMQFARDVSDRVIFMSEGIIEEQGTAEEVFGNPQSPRLKAFLSKVNV